MSIPSQPVGFSISQGNGDVALTWAITAGATSYSVQRSTDGVSFSVIASPVVNLYKDTTATINTLYYYRIASTNGSGTSGYTSALQIIPTESGDMSLAEIRLAAQQRADREGSNFVTTSEWNSYIVQSLFELYDLLVTLYEDYYVTSYQFTTSSNQQYTLPTDFYKLLGVDVGLASGTNGWITLNKFDFISRNKYVFPNLTSTFLGVFNLRYRLVGNTLMFIPTPSPGQVVRAWYIPKLVQPLMDTDVITGISGWTEYIITDAAIKALQKEESDVQVLAAQKMMLIKRIEETAMNRDAGQPDTISNVRNKGNGYGWDGGPNGGW